MLTIIDSKVDPNVYFIFRANGVEIKVEIVGAEIMSSLRLNAPERRYFNKLIPKRIAKEKRVYKNQHDKIKTYTKAKIIWYFINIENNTTTNISNLTNISKESVNNVLTEYLKFRK